MPAWLVMVFKVILWNAKQRNKKPQKNMNKRQFDWFWKNSFRNLHTKTMQIGMSWPYTPNFTVSDRFWTCFCPIFDRKHENRFSWNCITNWTVSDRFWARFCPITDRKMKIFENFCKIRNLHAENMQIGMPWPYIPNLTNLGHFRAVFGPILGLNGLILGPNIFFRHIEHQYLLDIKAIYHNLQNCKNLMIKTRENGQKP